MHTVAQPLDVTGVEEPASCRHRSARTELFPTPAAGSYDAREAAYLASLLADPLREIARTTADAEARAIAGQALTRSEATDDPFSEHARFEDALERIASATTDDTSCAIAEDAIALYRGR